MLLIKHYVRVFLNHLARVPAILNKARTLLIKYGYDIGVCDVCLEECTVGYKQERPTQTRYNIAQMLSLYCPPLSSLKIIADPSNVLPKCIVTRNKQQSIDVLPWV